MLLVNLLKLLRICTKCGTEFPLSKVFFEPHKASAYGLRRKCRDCERKLKRERVAKQTDEQREGSLIKRRARRAEKREQYCAAARAIYARTIDHQRARQRSWYQQNHEAVLKSAAKWRNTHKELIKSRKPTWKIDPIKLSRAKRRWYLKHREERLVYAREYRKSNPIKVALALFRYRARLRAAHGDATDEQIKARVDFFGGVCSYCGGPHEHLDHAIPIARGGTNWPANIRPACAHCNRSKQNKTVLEFLAWRRDIGLVC